MSYDTTEEQLRTLFAEAGAVVSVDMIKDRDTGMMKGFAFLTMGSQADAAKAISMFNGKELGGRPLKVNTAKPREERPGGGGGGGGKSYGNNSKNRNNRSGGYNNRY